MDCYWTTMAEENRQDMERLNKRIEELQAQYKQNKAQHLLKTIAKLNVLRNEARLNMHIYEKRAARYQQK